MMDLTLRTAAPVNTAVRANKSESTPLPGAFSLADAKQGNPLSAGFSEIAAPVSLRGTPGKQTDFTLPEQIKTPQDLAVQAEESGVDLSQSAITADLAPSTNLIPALNIAPTADLAPSTNLIPEAELAPSTNLIPAANIAPSSALIPATNAPVDLLAQVEGFTRSSQRTVLSTSSLFTDAQEGKANSDRVRDVIHLSNASSLPNLNSLPVKNVIGRSFVSAEHGQQNIISLPGINVSGQGLTEKTIEWAKVDLHAEVQQSDSKAATSSRIGEKLMAILQDRINIQASNNIKSAQIRLDPPDLGHIKLTVAIEGDKVSIGIVSHNSVVREGLMQTSERLRNELVNQNFVNVSVDISSGSEGQANKEKDSGEQVLANKFTAADEQTESQQDEFIVKV